LATINLFLYNCVCNTFIFNILVRMQQSNFLRAIPFFIFIALASVADFAKAQDAQFSQFYANPLYLNPAFAGSVKCPRVQMNTRNQWPGLNPFITHSVSYDQHVDAINGGLGLLVLSDRAGASNLSTTNVSGMYAYQLPVSHNFTMRAAFQASFHQRTVDWSRLTFGDMIDERRGFVYNTNEIPITEPVRTVDFSAGVLGYSKNFYAGLAVHHLTEPDEGLTRMVVPGNPRAKSTLPRRYTAHAGLNIPLDNRSDDVSISPNAMFMSQGGAQQYMLGVYANKGPFVGGLWYRHTTLTNNSDALALLVGLQQDIFKFGYSYDITVSKLSLTNTYGAHEFSLGLQFYCKPKRKRVRMIKCPSF
jgi:type IX secretion system PorP/SprF family membrane protein